ncbi:MAG: hypothetical protein ACLQJR_02990 [Stellaceae bacterium]
MGTRKTDFQKYLPTFTEDQAVRSYSYHGGEVLSFSVRPVAPDLFAVAFATRTEVFGPVSLNPLVARGLLQELEKHVARLDR